MRHTYMVDWKKSREYTIGTNAHAALIHQPEYLLRATLLQAFFTVRSERQLMEQIDYNLLFRWFVGLSMDDAVWDHSSFSTNRDRLLEAGVASKFFSSLLPFPKLNHLLSAIH